MITWNVIEYIDQNGMSPFARWFSRINEQSAAKITTTIYRLGQGNFSNVKSVGKGVYENKISFGPGYRVYFGQEGNNLIIILCGGTKQRQNKDVKRAQKYWADYKRQKRIQRGG